MGRIILITGGARSGKSGYALERASAYPRKVFLATAMAFDEEMKDRIARHRAERDSSYLTIEEPEHPARTLAALPEDAGVVLMDCVTVWLANLTHLHGVDCDSYPQVEEFIAALPGRRADIIIVTNEVGMGIVPDNPLARRFRDLAGRLNARLARAADEVVFMVSGIPLVIKSQG